MHIITLQGRVKYLVFVTALVGSVAQAQTTQPSDKSESDHSAAAWDLGKSSTTQPAAMSLNYHVPSRAYNVIGETEPPRYSRTLSKTGIETLKDFYWLDFGLDHRTRFEYHEEDYRQSVLKRDTPFLMRSRGYLGIHDIIDPLRFAFEFQDSRQFNSDFPDVDRDVNEYDILQGYGELHLKNALGAERPFRFQAGRFAMDYMDRRLISRNGWRNTTNNFDGFRAIFGQQTNDWQLDIFAVQPVVRRVRQLDRSNEDEWLFGVIGQWRRWSKYTTLQPYYLVRDQDRKNAFDREIHAVGLRAHGVIGDTNFDYDNNLAWQFGKSGDENHRAFGFGSELGYTFEHDWKPRISTAVVYASGDRNPLDSVDERFDRFYGAARPLSQSDYLIWENVITPKVRFELKPHKTLILEAAYGGFWLASDSDSWFNANRRDPSGQSGDCIGHEVDLRVRWKINPRVEIIAGYAHFEPGAFTKNTGDADDSDFLYVETSIQLFK